jgi:hypothetical protein
MRKNFGKVAFVFDIGFKKIKDNVVKRFFYN